MQVTDAALYGKPVVMLAQSITLPDLSQLPPWAVISFGVSLAVIVGMGWWGERAGRRSTAAPQSGAQIAAVIVDPSALNAAAASVDGLTVVITTLVVTLREMNLTAARTAQELDAVREEMRIHRELSRK